jgi:tetratricopeptide (TPR) repeat protein
MSARTWLLFILACGCGAPQRTSATTLTAAEYREEYRHVGAAEVALQHGEPVKALASLERALKIAPNDPWALYEHATALSRIGHTDEAARELVRAEGLFGDAHPHGKELAIYGRARLLHDAGRCAEARAAYEAYAAFVRPRDPASADLALAYERDCREPTPNVVDLTVTDQALMSAEYAAALSRATERLQAARTPADRAPIEEAQGEALIGLGRYREGIDVLERAATDYGDDRAGRARALYGEARAQRAGGFCDDAARAYARYADFVRAFAPEDAAMAERYAHDCPGLAPTPAAPKPK